MLLSNCISVTVECTMQDVYGCDFTGIICTVRGNHHSLYPCVYRIRCERGGI